MRRATILIADDHAIVREGLVSLLRASYDVVDAVGDGHSLVDAASRLRPDIIVTDLSMPGIAGLDVVVRLRALAVESKVIVLTMHNDAELATQTLRAGASGFLLKLSAGDELVTAINEVLMGHVYLTPTLTREVMTLKANPVPAPGAALTARQREVLKLIVEGRRMKEIAAALNLSTRTVESHKYEMMATLGLGSTAELVRYALEHQLVD
jgi:DNA-binding NarL/FixJ family response regulator